MWSIPNELTTPTVSQGWFIKYLVPKGMETKSVCYINSRRTIKIAYKYSNCIVILCFSLIIVSFVELGLQ